MKKGTPEYWNGLHIVGQCDQGPLVDVRALAKKLRYQNRRAEQNVVFKEKMQLVGVTDVCWEPSEDHSEYKFSDVSAALCFKAEKKAACFCCAAIYLKDGIWTAVHAGSDRKNSYRALHNEEDGKWTPTGATKKKQWCTWWNKDCPTVCFSIASDGSFITYGIALDSSYVAEHLDELGYTEEIQVADRTFELTIPAKGKPTIKEITK